MAVRAGSSWVPRVVAGRGVAVGQVVIGWWPVLAHRVRNPGVQGQCSGRWRWMRLAEVAILAETLIRFLRIVAPVAFAWNRDRKSVV